VKIFEKVTMNFLNDNLPTNYTVTMVEVRNQQLLRSSVRRTLRELQPSPSLEVDMYIEGSGAPSTDILSDEIETSFERQKDTFENLLADASSLFRKVFNPSPVIRPIDGDEEQGNVGELFLAAGSIFGVLSVTVIALLFIKYRQTKKKTDNQQLEILSWSTSSAGGALKGLESKDDGGQEIVLIDSISKEESKINEIPKEEDLDYERDRPPAVVSLNQNAQMTLSDSLDTPDLPFCVTSSADRTKNQEGKKNDHITGETLDNIPLKLVKSGSGSTDAFCLRCT